MATLPMNINFTTTSANYDLFADTTIINQIAKHYDMNIVNAIAQGNAGMKLNIFINSTTQIKFDITDNYQSFLVDVVYSSNGTIFPRHCYIKDSGITGTLSMQIV